VVYRAARVAFCKAKVLGYATRFVIATRQQTACAHTIYGMRAFLSHSSADMTDRELILRPGWNVSSPMSVSPSMSPRFRICREQTLAFQAVALMFTLLSAAAAQSIPVAILGSPAGGAVWNSDVQAKLLSTGQFSTVDTYLINEVTPTLAQLQTYKAVLVYSDHPGFADSVTLGNNLADYVDAGGGVVVAVFADASFPFAGRFATDDYWAIEPGAQTQGVHLTLGTVHIAGSPLLAGVLSFDGGSSSYAGTAALNAAAVDVADWSDGAPLIASRVIGGTNRVDLNFFPPSNAVRSDLWLHATDGAKLMANALNYVAGVTLPAQPAWIPLQPSGTPPSPRGDASGIYTGNSTNVMVVFAGNTAGCNATTPSLNDTWALAGANGLGGGTPAWSQIAMSGTLPSGRRGHSAVYNSATDRMIVFGGDSFGCSSHKLNDVWVLTHASGTTGTATWQQLTPSGTLPEARSDHVAVYNQTSNQMIVFGGDGNLSTNLTDLWVLANADGTTGTPQWTNPTPSGTGPSGTAYMAGAYDPGSNVMTLYGGFDCCAGPAFNHLWFLSNANGTGGTPAWRLVSANNTPPTAKVGTRGVYNPTSNVAEYFAGSGTNQTWTLTNANGVAQQAWTRLFPAVVPPGRGGLAANPAVVLDPSSGRMIIFGGLGPEGAFNDVWLLP